MDWSVVIVVLVVGWLTTFVNCTTKSCPTFHEGCHCGLPKHGDRVMCRNSTWTNFDFLNFTGFPENITYLSLTDTSVTKLNSDFSQHLPLSISKLNLSNNKINKIEDNAFGNLSRLEKLDLSHNSISTLNQAAFNGLNSLRKLDLQGNILMCDCHLSWILEWARQKNMKITSKSNCHFPAQLRGVSLAKIHKKDMHCDWPLQLPVFEMAPSSSQLVFEGDPMLFQCNVSDIDQDTQVTWTFDGQQLPLWDGLGEKESGHLSVSTDHLGLLISSLQIGHLQVNHSGLWLCHVGTSRGNLSRSVRLVVVAKMAPFCPEIITWGNKGNYHWPQTLAGVITDLPCAAPPSPYGLGYQPARAYHTCSPKGKWMTLDDSSCSYVSEVTLVLEQFAKDNLSQIHTIVDTARGLRNYTGNGSMLTDVIHVIFITRTLEKYLSFVPQYKELSDILLDVISVLMNVKPHLLDEAQAQEETSTRLTKIVDSLPEALSHSAISRYNENLIVEEFIIKPESFHGIRCSSFEDNLNDRLHKRNLHCLSVNNTMPLKAEKGFEASVFVPPSIFQSLSPLESQSLPSSPWGHTHKLYFAFYVSSVLFPRRDMGNPAVVTSSVISCISAHLPLGNFSQPVEVTLQLPIYTSDVQPVFWDHNTNDGKGDWNPNGCQPLSVMGNRITFSCPFLGTFGILQDLKAMKKELLYQQAQFRLLHPAIYAGSFFILACLLVSIGLYCKQWQHVHMNKNSKHSIVNTWLSLWLLVLVFTLGVPQTDIPRLCQVIGLLLHYLTLCTLTWMVITINNLYKSLSRLETSEFGANDEDDEPRDPSVPPKPILRFYLVGWGVASIVCGISAAVQMDHYAGPHFCFLSQSSSLAALYGPVTILLLLLLIYIMLIRCFVGQGNEVSGLPLVVQNGKSPSADAHSIIDLEFSSSKLLHLHGSVLLLFLLTWVSAVLAIARPFFQQLPFNNLIFSLLYLLFSVILGLVIFFFFCYLRGDVRKCLSRPRPKPIEEVELECNTNFTEAVAPRAVENENPLPEEPAKLMVNQVNEVASSKTCEINLLTRRNPPADIAGSMELFYNPRQSIVARKFFEKNRRQQQLKNLHKNNLEKEAAINGSGRTRAYSDTEHATSAASGERSFLCTSQSYGGPSHQAELKALVHCSEQPKIASGPPQSQFYNFTITKDNFGLPPWMVGAPCTRSSCSECSNCTKPPLSLYSYSDITSVSQRGNRRRPHSRNYSKYQKAHQYSWDDKYGDSGTKVFSQGLQEGSATTGHSQRKYRRKVGSRNSVHLSPTPEKVSSKNAFSRSQSANEQIGKHRVLLNESKNVRSQDQLEPQL